MIYLIIISIVKKIYLMKLSKDYKEYLIKSGSWQPMGPISSSKGLSSAIYARCDNLLIHQGTSFALNGSVVQKPDYLTVFPTVLFEVHTGGNKKSIISNRPR